MTDFSRLRLKSNRKQYLVAPAGHTADAPHRAAPIFDRPVHQLAGDFRRHALEQPGVTLKEVSSDGRILELIHRSGLFGIASQISAQFMPIENGRSTLIVYSRTKYGNRHTNRKRIEEWLAAIGASPDFAEDQKFQPVASPANA